jgi:hypothetical protein
MSYPSGWDGVPCNPVLPSPYEKPRSCNYPI